MARRIRDPEQRNQIVRAASRLVAKHGVTATTMRAVAAETGVSTGSVTHYFEDKAELMDEVLRDAGDRVAKCVNAAVSSHRGLEAAKQATLGLLPVDDERLACWQVWLAFWPTGTGEHPSAGGFAEGYEAWRHLLRKHLRQAIEAAEIPEGLDLNHEINVLGTLVAGTSVLAGAGQANRNKLRRRAERIFSEHFTRMTGRDAAEKL